MKPYRDAKAVISYSATLLVCMLLLSCRSTSAADSAHGVNWPPARTSAEIGLPEKPNIGTEIRVWLGGGVIHPYDLYRIFQGEEGMTGEHIVWTEMQKADDWSPPRSAEEVKSENDKTKAFMEDNYCQDAVMQTSDIQFCKAKIESTVHWDVIAKDLMPAQLWKLPEKIERDNRWATFDGEIVTIEIADANKHHIVQFDNPDFNCAELACAIANHVREVVRGIQ